MQCRLALNLWSSCLQPMKNRDCRWKPQAVAFSSRCKSKVALFPQEDTKQILVTNIIWLFVWLALYTGQCGFVLSSHVPWQFCKVAATSTPISLSSEGTGCKGEEPPVSDHEASSVSLRHSSSPYQEEFFFIFEVIFAWAYCIDPELSRLRIIKKWGPIFQSGWRWPWTSANRWSFTNSSPWAPYLGEAPTGCWETRLGNSWFHCEPFFALSAWGILGK